MNKITSKQKINEMEDILCVLKKHYTSIDHAEFVSLNKIIEKKHKKLVRNKLSKTDGKNIC